MLYNEFSSQIDLTTELEQNSMSKVNRIEKGISQKTRIIIKLKGEAEMKKKKGRTEEPNSKKTVNDHTKISSFPISDLINPAR